MDAEQPAEPNVEERRPCPECGEHIVVGAILCRFCGTTLNQETGEAVRLPPEPVYAASTPSDPTSRYATASLILGASSFAIIFCCWPLAVPVSVIGIVMGVLGMKSKQRSLAIVGVVLSVLSIVGMGGLFLFMFLAGI